MRYQYKGRWCRGIAAKMGALIGPNDLILAATVIANDGSLATRNVGEFKRLARLKLEAW